MEICYCIPLHLQPSLHFNGKTKYINTNMVKVKKKGVEDSDKHLCKKLMYEMQGLLNLIPFFPQAFYSVQPNIMLRAKLKSDVNQSVAWCRNIKI